MAAVGSSANAYRALVSTPAWLRDVVLGVAADAAASAFTALLCGVRWAALEVHQSGTFALRACGECGHAYPDLAVHLVLGMASDGAACTGAADARSDLPPRW